MKTLPLIFPVLLTACLAGDVLAQAQAKEAPAASAPSKVQDVTPDEVEKLRKENPEIVILDVRTPDEFSKGHLAGAINDDFLDDGFAGKLSALEGKTIVVHCAAGGRSKRSLKVLTEHNIPKIYHMNGGYNAWKKAGKPVEGAAKDAK